MMDVGLLIIAIVGLVFAGGQLKTIRKSAELTASQAVMDTYYHARNLVVESAQRNNERALEIVKYNFEIEQLAQNASNEVRLEVSKLMLEGEELRNRVHEQALTDYAKIVSVLCWQHRNEVLGDSASFFIEKVVRKDVNDVMKLIVSGSTDSSRSFSPAVQEIYKEMQSDCKTLW